MNRQTTFRALFASVLFGVLILGSGSAYATKTVFRFTPVSITINDSLIIIRMPEPSGGYEPPSAWGCNSFNGYFRRDLTGEYKSMLAAILTALAAGKKISVRNNVVLDSNGDPTPGTESCVGNFLRVDHIIFYD